jgi:L-threonylcarbamoyladenylate synthase
MPQVMLAALIAGVNSGQYLISFPTDTLPALAARPDSAELIFATKQRSLDKPLILMAATGGDLWPYVQGTAAERQVWQEVADRHWPGALTLVLPASDLVPAMMNPQDPTTIGVRVPNCAIAQTILAQTGPLATTSANRSGQPALQTMAEILAEFPQVLTLAATELPHLPPAEISASASGIASTVARWTGAGWEILRQGTVRLGCGDRVTINNAQAN